MAEGAISMAASTTISGSLIGNPGAVDMGDGGQVFGRMLSTKGAVSVYGTVASSMSEWIKTISNKWNTPGNWSSNAIPASYNNVNITTGTSVVSSTTSASCNNLTVNGGSLTINSDDLSSGSLIVAGTASGNITYDRFVSAGQWHIISAPVGNQSIDNFLANPSNSIAFKDSVYAMTTYDENLGRWNSFYSATGNGLFEVGKGYLVGRSTTAGLLSFTGTIADADFTYPVTNTIRGWNCVGNPFTSALGAITGTSSTSNFIEVNGSLLDESHLALYLWDEQANYDGTLNDYEIFSNVGYTPDLVDNYYVQTGQGFMIKANAAGNISFTKDMQYHDTGTGFLKSSKSSWDGFKLMAESNEEVRSCIIAFHEDMTTGLDPSYDVGMFKQAGKFAIYTRLAEEDNDIDFEIQCLPEEIYEEIIVPVGVDMIESGTVKLSIGGIILNGKKFISLEDRDLGNIVNLESEEDFYEADIPSGDNTGRFFLHIEDSKNDVSDKKIKEKTKYKAYWNGSEIVLESSIPSSARVTIIDLNGMIHYEYYIHEALLSYHSFSSHRKGIYFLRILEENEVTTLKVNIF